MTPEALTANLKRRAAELGFQLAGACPAVTPEGLPRFDEWLSRGYAGAMHYLPDRRAAYEHPRHVLDGARSILMLGMNYATREPAEPAAGEGRVSRYAWGAADYHDVIRDRLNQLAGAMREWAPEAKVRGVVDTAPLAEREFAQLAGLGWVGKHTLLLNRRQGSWFFLAALLTDRTLGYDEPHRADHCGSCTACLDACPTNAFPQPYVLDATRCISYLTIELREAIPPELREGMGDWLFGCDVCQEVCPWNRRAPRSAEAAFDPSEDLNPVDAASLFDLDDDAFRTRFRHTPLWRAKRRGILRNAAIVLGNNPSERGLAALLKGVADQEPLVRAAAAWALAQYHGEDAASILRQRLAVEDDADVLSELRAALQETNSTTIK